MDSRAILELVEQLEDNIDDLEESLEPLLAAALAATTKKLPVLDRAKVNVLVVYAIESLLFSYLKLHGVDAKDHPVFRELTRVKQYFGKIKTAEDGPIKPREKISLNKEAANRVIKFSLAGNDKYDLERREREAREKLLAKRKLKDLETAMKEKAAASGEEDDHSVSLQQLIQESLPAEVENAVQVSADEGEVSEDDGQLSEEGDVEDDSQGERFESSPQQPAQDATPSQKLPKNRKRKSAMGGAATPSKKARKQKKKKGQPSEQNGNQKSKRHGRKDRRSSRQSANASNNADQVIAANGHG